MQTQAPDLADRLSEQGYGDKAELRELLPSVYADLKRIAHRQLFRNVQGATLSTTVLVHETYARIAEQPGGRSLSRAHFVSLCARVMRQVVIDHLRAHGADKRGGGARLELLESDAAVEPQFHALLTIAEALDTLSDSDVRLARLIEHHWFLGLEPDELAAVHGVTLRTIQRELKRARAWLGELLVP